MADDAISDGIPQRKGPTPSTMPEINPTIVADIIRLHQDSSFPILFNALLEATGVRQAALARATQINTSAISQYSSHNQVPKQKNLDTIMDAFHLTGELRTMVQAVSDRSRHISIPGHPRAMPTIDPAVIADVVRNNPDSTFGTLLRALAERTGVIQMDIVRKLAKERVGYDSEKARQSMISNIMSDRLIPPPSIQITIAGIFGVDVAILNAAAERTRQQIHNVQREAPPIDGAFVTATVAICERDNMPFHWLLDTLMQGSLPEIRTRDMGNHVGLPELRISSYRSSRLSRPPTPDDVIRLAHVFDPAGAHLSAFQRAAGRSHIRHNLKNHSGDIANLLEKYHEEGDFAPFFDAFMHTLAWQYRSDVMAHAIGIEPVDVLAWRDGKALPTSEHIARLADACAFNEDQRRIFMHILERATNKPVGLPEIFSHILRQAIQQQHDFSTCLGQLMEESGMDVAEVAAQSGINAAVISACLDGTHIPEIEDINQLACTFRLSDVQRLALCIIAGQSENTIEQKKEQNDVSQLLISAYRDNTITLSAFLQNIATSTNITLEDMREKFSANGISSRILDGTGSYAVPAAILRKVAGIVGLSTDAEVFRLLSALAKRPESPTTWTKKISSSPPPLERE